MKKILTSIFVAAFTAIHLSAAASATPVFQHTRADYLNAITVGYNVNLDLTSAGVDTNTFPNAIVDGSDIYSTGVDVNFSSPLAPDPTRVAVTEFPELGPVGPNSAKFARDLKVTFSAPVDSFGGMFFGLTSFTLTLFDENGVSIYSGSQTNASRQFFGVVETSGFSSLLISTGNTFWSVSGGDFGTTGFASPTQLVGQIHQPVPEPATMLLLASGLFGGAAARRRKMK